jgi:hypothetical protein
MKKVASLPRPLYIYRIWGSHSSGHEELYLLKAMQSSESQLTFQRNMSTPSSESKNMPSMRALFTICSQDDFLDLKMEATCSPKTLVDFQQTTLCNSKTDTHMAAAAMLLNWSEHLANFCSMIKWALVSRWICFQQNRIELVLTMVYNTQNYWVFWTSLSSIRKKCNPLILVSILCMLYNMFYRTFFLFSPFDVAWSQV